MTRNGTCRHTYQAQEVSRGSSASDMQPVVDTTDCLTCQWLSGKNARLPPPIARQNGTFEIRPGDCDDCTHYQPPDVPTWHTKKTEIEARR